MKKKKSTKIKGHRIGGEIINNETIDHFEIHEISLVGIPPNLEQHIILQKSRKGSQESIIFLKLLILVTFMYLLDYFLFK